MTKVKPALPGGLEVGSFAPNFEAIDEAGKRHALKDYRGKTVILYFYPKDHTSGCTQEACDFRDNFDNLRKRGAVILGVSGDSAQSHQRFKEKHQLPFPLLLDEDRSMAKAYGVWGEKSMYGRKFMGITRSTFVIGADGRLEHVYRKVSVPGHVKELLEAAR